MTIKQKNIMIAEFMGYKLSKSGYGGWSDNNIRFYYETKESKARTFFDSWDLLIPVIKKIKSLTNQTQMINVDLMSLDINNLFNSVVEFIEFYNENK